MKGPIAGGLVFFIFFRHLSSGVRARTAQIWVGILRARVFHFRNGPKFARVNGGLANCASASTLNLCKKCSNFGSKIARFIFVF